MRVFISVLALCLAVNTSWAQRSRPQPATLPPERTKSGSLTLRAFQPVVADVRHSVVIFEVEGKELALGAVIDSSGLVVTKASELPPGQLSCRLPEGERVDARVQATDEDTDLCLVKVNATGLRPIEWSSQPVSVGQWVITPGIESDPEAIGIVSIPTRKIPPKRALIGVQLDFAAPDARIGSLLPGMGAEKAGLKPGDVILAVNSTAVTNREQLITQLGTFRDGQTVQLRFRREEEELQARVELTVPKPDERARRFNRLDRMNRLGSRLSTRAEGFELAIQHDTVLQAWQCGGPLLNLDGKVVGLNIARAGRVASYALPADLLGPAIEALKKKAQLPVNRETGSPTGDMQ
jgi:serine protease Do